MDRYRYFVSNQRNMVVLGVFRIAFSTLCVTSGFIDGIFRTESLLGKTRAPVWAGMVMGVLGILALFSLQRKNPVLVGGCLEPNDSQNIPGNQQPFFLSQCFFTALMMTPFSWINEASFGHPASTEEGEKILHPQNSGIFCES